MTVLYTRVNFYHLHTVIPAAYGKLLSGEQATIKVQASLPLIYLRSCGNSKKKMYDFFSPLSLAIYCLGV